MTTASFEFSAAEAQNVQIKKSAALSKNPKLDLSLDEISKNERKERIEAKKQNAKDKKEKKPKKEDHKKGNDKTNDRKKSSDIKVKEIQKGKGEKAKKEYKINIPESMVKEFLEQAGVKTDKYKVSVCISRLFGGSYDIHILC